MTTINFTCPECGHSMQLPAALAGKNGKCPKCQKDVLVVGDLNVASSLPQTTQPIPTQPQVSPQQAHQQAPQQSVAPVQQQYQQQPPLSAPVQQPYQQTPQQLGVPVQHTLTPSQQHPPHEHTTNTLPSVQALNSTATNEGQHSTETHNQLDGEAHDKKSVRGLVYKLVAGIVGVTGIAGVLAVGFYFNEQNTEELSPNTEVGVQQSDVTAPEDALAAMTNRLNGKWIYVSGDKKPLTLDFEKGTFQSGDEMEIRCEVVGHNIEKRELTFRNLLDEPFDFDPDPSNERLVSGVIFNVRFTDDLEEQEIATIGLSMLNEDDRPLEPEYIALIKMDSTTAPEDAPATSSVASKEIERETFESGVRELFVGETVAFLVEKLGKPGRVSNGGKNLFYPLNAKDKLTGAEYTHIQFNTRDGITISTASIGSSPQSWPQTEQDNKSNRKQINREASLKALRMKFIGLTTAEIVDEFGKPTRVLNGGTDLFFTIEWEDELTGAIYRHIQIDINRETNRCDDVNIGVTEL